MKYLLIFLAALCGPVSYADNTASFGVSATVTKHTQITYQAQPHELWVTQEAINRGTLETIGVYYRVKRNHTEPFQIVFMPLTGQPTAITINDKIEVGVTDVPVYVTIDSPNKELDVRVQYTFILPSLYMPRPDIYEFPIEVSVQ